MKIIFVGDPHLDNRTPLMRLDDYATTTIEKLNTIKDLAITNGVKVVILSGDTFDKDNYDQPLSYINKIISVCKEFQNNDIEVYSVIGNHDLRHNKMEYFENSPLNILFQAGVVKHLTKAEYNDIRLYGLDFTQIDEIDKINSELDINKINILTMHYATDNTIPNESVARNRINNFDIVLSGHDHNYYPIDYSQSPIVLRPGSMVRRTKDAYNLVRQPLVYLFDSETKEIQELIISNKPANQVFKTTVFIDNTDYTNNEFTALFNEQYFKRDTISLKEMVEQLPPPVTPNTKNKLLTYIKSQGF